MSVIANVMCTPNRLEMLVRAIAAEPEGIDADELLGRLSPGVLRDEQGDEGGGVMARRVLQEATGLRLVEKRVDLLFLTDPSSADPARLQAWLHDHLTDAQAADEVDQKAFPRALAWFLTQDPLHPIPTASTDPSETAWALIGASLGEDSPLYELGSEAPFRQFGYWARYLGYATHLRTSRSRTAFAPDPTEAVSRIVETRFKAGEEFPIREFVDRLGQYSPVLDGGATRAQIEASLVPALRPDRSRDLSRSLSYAFACLDDARVLRLHSRADAPQLALVIGDTRRSCTHVTVGSHHA